MRLKGKRAIITGGGRGIGKGIAQRFAEEGARLVLADRLAEPLEATAEEIRKQGAEVISLVCDLAQPESAEKLVSHAVESLGGLDILINNAGTSSIGFIETVSDAEFDRLMEVNVQALFRMTRHAAGPMKEGGWGRIVNLSSVEGIRGSGLLPLYCASKHAVVGLTRSTAVELGRNGITVNCICPGPIETDMLAPLIANENLLNKVIKRVPVRRLGQPVDIANAALFLASEEAGFVTGHALVVDGGLTVDA